MDWSNPVGSAVSGAFGLAGSALSYYFNKKLQNQQNEYNLNMWNLQNEYNSPAAQMRRYEEAGLNPALMYGQVTPGNASSAPVQGVPKAPELSEDMRQLAQAFNIEGLKTAIANRKKAQADARIAGANADDAESTNYALRRLYWDYHFDPTSGRFVYDGGFSKSADGSVHSKDVLPFYQRYGEGKLMRMLSDNFRYNSLIVPRAGLIGSQTNLNAGRYSLIPDQSWLLQRRAEMYGPQLRMLNYQAKYFPWTFWIGNTKQGVQTIAPFLP